MISSVSTVPDRAALVQAADRLLDVQLSTRPLLGTIPQGYELHWQVDFDSLNQATHGLENAVGQATAAAALLDQSGDPSAARSIRELVLPGLESANEIASNWTTLKNTSTDTLRRSIETASTNAAAIAVRLGQR